MHRQHLRRELVVGKAIHKGKMSCPRLIDADGGPVTDPARVDQIIFESFAHVWEFKPVEGPTSDPLLSADFRNRPRSPPDALRAPSNFPEAPSCRTSHGFA